ncbi:Cationic peroxidase 1 [Linum perenne]
MASSRIAKRNSKLKTQNQRDSTTASRTTANNDIPSPFLDLPALRSSFQKQGLNDRDLVALSGGHTIGFASASSLETASSTTPPPPSTPSSSSANGKPASPTPTTPTLPPWTASRRVSTSRTSRTWLSRKGCSTPTMRFWLRGTQRI